jgi:hypothetical protein
MGSILKQSIPYYRPARPPGQSRKRRKSERKQRPPTAPARSSEARTVGGRDSILIVEGGRHRYQAPLET